MEKKKERTWASEHHQNFAMVMSAEERRVANIDARNIAVLLVLPEKEKAMD
jgi:hypothetical protein